jgi:hypothetical protein
MMIGMKKIIGPITGTTTGMADGTTIHTRVVISAGIASRIEIHGMAGITADTLVPIRDAITTGIMSRTTTGTTNEPSRCWHGGPVRGAARVAIIEDLSVFAWRYKLHKLIEPISIETHNSSEQCL